MSLRIQAEVVRLALLLPLVGAGKDFFVGAPTPKEERKNDVDGADSGLTDLRIQVALVKRLSQKR